MNNPTSKFEHVEFVYSIDDGKILYKRYLDARTMKGCWSVCRNVDWDHNRCGWWEIPKSEVPQTVIDHHMRNMAKLLNDREAVDENS